MYKIGNVIIILKGLKKANESICLKLFQTQQKGKYNVEYNVHYAKKFETLKNYLCIYSNNQNVTRISVPRPGALFTSMRA